MNFNIDIADPFIEPVIENFANRLQAIAATFFEAFKTKFLQILKASLEELRDAQYSKLFALFQLICQHLEAEYFKVEFEQAQQLIKKVIQVQSVQFVDSTSMKQLLSAANVPSAKASFSVSELKARVLQYTEVMKASVAAVVVKILWYNIWAPGVENSKRWFDSIREYNSSSNFTYSRLLQAFQEDKDVADMRRNYITTIETLKFLIASCDKCKSVLTIVSNSDV